VFNTYAALPANRRIAFRASSNIKAGYAAGATAATERAVSIGRCQMRKPADGAAHDDEGMAKAMTSRAKAG